MSKEYTAAEYFTLPSLGKIYGESGVSPRVKLRSMTTAEEMRRLSASDRPYENMCSIIDDCIIDGPHISSYDMCMADYTFLLFKLRVVTYGNGYPVASTCPLCGTRNEGSINIDDIKINELTEDALKYQEFELPSCKKKIKIKFQTPRMLDNINERIKDYKRKSSDKTLDSTLLYSIEHLIETIDGKKPDPIEITEWIRGLNMMDTNTITQYSEKLETVIGIDRTLTINCDLCGYEYQSKLAVTREFFRPTLDI